jgi:RNA polymerase sigma-70 factor (ECF subfamily)
MVDDLGTQLATTKPVGVFATTHWTLVMDAADSQAPGSLAALEQLCQAYWFPLYAYVRRLGRSAEDASDLTQEFFARVLEKKTLKVADQERGKFRTFLLTALKNFLAKEHEKANRQKRGGGATHLSLDFQDAEGRFIQEPSHDCAPDRLFEREWAKALLERVLLRLRDEFSTAGQPERFTLLSAHLVEPEECGSYADTAAKLKMSEGAVKTAMHRLRARYRELYREEIAAQVGSPEEVEAEIQHLFRTLES